MTRLVMGPDGVLTAIHPIRHVFEETVGSREAPYDYEDRSRRPRRLDPPPASRGLSGGQILGVVLATALVVALLLSNNIVRIGPISIATSCTPWWSKNLERVRTNGDTEWRIKSACL